MVNFYMLDTATSKGATAWGYSSKQEQ